MSFELIENKEASGRDSSGLQGEAQTAWSAVDPASFKSMNAAKTELLVSQGTLPAVPLGMGADSPYDVNDTVPITKPYVIYPSGVADKNNTGIIVLGPR